MTATFARVVSEPSFAFQLGWAQPLETFHGSSHHFLPTSVLARMTPLTQLSEEETLFRDSVRGFAQERILPLRSYMDEHATMDTTLVRQLFEMGVMAIEVPEAYGGAGSSFFNAILAVEAIATVDGSVSVLVDVQNTLVNNALLRWGTDAQKTKYLPRMAQEWVGSYALSEVGSGSDAFALKAKATDAGDHYILTGQKLWITNAMESSLYIVLANVAPEQGYKGYHRVFGRARRTRLQRG